MISPFGIEHGVISKLALANKHGLTPAGKFGVATATTAAVFAAGAKSTQNFNRRVGVNTSFKDAFLHPVKSQRAGTAGLKHAMVVHQVGQQMANSTGRKVQTRYGTTLTPQGQ